MAGQTIAISVLADTAPFAKAMKNVGVGVGVALAAVSAGVIALGAEAFKAVAEVERLNAQTSAALASTGGAAQRTIDQITGVADSLERMSGVEAEVIQGAQNMLLTFTNIKGDQFDSATKAALDMSVAMGTDMTSAATLVGKALNDPIKGVGALSKVGVQLTADQKAMVEQMTAVGDVAGAQGVILGVLNEQFGGSAEAFGSTFLGTLEKVKNSFGAIPEALVSGLLPAATAGLNVVNDALLAIADAPAFAVVTERVGAFLAGLFGGKIQFGDLLAGLVPSLISSIQGAASWLAGGGLAPIIEGFNSGREALLTGFLQVMPAIIQGLITAIPNIASAVLSLISGMVTLLVQSAPAILAAGAQMFVGLVQSAVAIIPQVLEMLLGLLPSIITALVSMIPSLTGTALTLFTALVQALVTVVPKVLTTIVSALPKIVASLLSMLPRLIDAALNLFLGLVKGLVTAIPQVLKALLNALPKIVSTLIGMVPRLIDAAIRLFTGLVQAIPRVLPQLIGALVGMAPRLVGAIIGLIPQLIRAGIDLVGGLVQGLWRAASSVGSALLKIAKDAIGGFLNFLGIRSPSRLFAGYGKNVVQGLAGGLVKNGALVDRAMDGLSARVSDGFATTLPPIDYTPTAALSSRAVVSDARPASEANRAVQPAQVTELGPASLQWLANNLQLTVALDGRVLASSASAQFAASTYLGGS